MREHARYRTRHRLLGADIFQQVREAVPLDLVGMDAEALGGLGEVPPAGNDVGSGAEPDHSRPDLHTRE